ncbi:MAG: Vi polysaccharide biosynthesis UDP-N-acetylglucosamine C-6 dehydrogenase TviB [Pseudomonadales bacterium]
MPNLKNSTIGVLGLGYVGLPLAVEFGKKISTIGFDINKSRIGELERHHDATLEVDSDALKCASKLSFSSDLDDLRQCNIYIVTVPTPIDEARRPNLAPLISASRTIGQVIKAGDLVIYESTVYPGATEDDCIPVIEKESGLTFNKDFYAGYSPERINPGDKEHRLPDIKKVTSGSTPEIADLVDELYRMVITAGTHKASSLKVAEAAKVIENTQRDLNIALINELALIFERMGLDTHEVLAAAGTKWNFLPFKPGLVGGHCIGVDPYYLTYKAQEYDYHPEVILAGRRINDNMGSHIAHRVVKLMTQSGINAVDAKVLVLGFAFKENCPDLRNTRVIDVINELKSYHLDVEICDPWVDSDEAQHEYGVTVNAKPSGSNYSAIVLCVAHDEFVAMGGDGIAALAADNHIVYDVKGILPKELVSARL